ncbi:MAG TPA: aminoglycoside phosphotransferase family protein [Anaerolineae bacterium]|nr:aminoglycoside phosphotransferase family protein [Anaerolineae bacterium]
MAESWPDDVLANLVAAHLPVDPDRLVFDPIRTGKHNRSYYVGGAGQELVLRISPPDRVADAAGGGFLFYEQRMMAQEPGLHALLRAETTIPVAQILAYDDSRQLVDHDYMIMERLPGRPLSELRLGASQLDAVFEQVGAYLAQMHALVADRYGYLPPLPAPGNEEAPRGYEPMVPQPSWVRAFEIMWNRLLDDVVACGGYTSEEAAAFRRLFDVYRPHFDRPVPASLLHMDVWGQNILVDEKGMVTGLVDLDRALWGDPEIEYAVLDYTGISEPGFWRGYRRVRDTSFPAQVRARFYTLYEVQKYIPIRIWRRDDPRAALDYKRQSFALARPLIQALGES